MAIDFPIATVSSSSTDLENKKSAESETKSAAGSAESAGSSSVTTKYDSVGGKFDGNLQTKNALDIKIKGVEGKTRAGIAIAKKADLKDVTVQLKSDATSSDTTGIHVGDDAVVENLSVNMDF